MKTETRKIYRCEYCKKVYLVSSAALKHEKKCKSNPENYRPCLDGCINLDKKETIASFYQFSGESDVRVKCFYCNKLNNFVYPPGVEIGEKEFELEDGNFPMPKTCLYAEKTNWLCKKD